MSTPTATAANRGPLPESFYELNAELPLRPIRDGVDYDNAAEMIDRLAVLDTRTDDQDDYLSTLTVLLSAYDDQHYGTTTAVGSPAEVVRFLCEQNGLNASGLGDLLGDRSLGSKVLRRERELSKSHIRTLCARFAVSADLFLRS